jgi:hypothetical protein
MGRTMTEAEQILRDILERGDITGRDASGRTIIELAVNRATLERLMAFGADQAEAEDGGDDEPYGVPSVDALLLPSRRIGGHCDRLRHSPT